MAKELGASFTCGADFCLADGEVHVWYANIAATADTAALERILSPDEKIRASRFIFEEDRRAFVVSRGTLRRVLANYLAIDTQEVRFSYSSSNKPALVQELGSDLHFNLSHSKNLFALAITKGRRTGIDVEFMRRDIDVDGIARRFFSSHEQEELEQLSGKEKHQAFFNCWTRKEAYVKAVGKGLALGLRNFDVSLGRPAALLATRPDPEHASRWSMASLDLWAEYVGAVVAEGASMTLKLHPVATYLT